MFGFLYLALCNSTPVQVLRAQVRLLPLPVPVWRSSARLRSSSATVEAPAIITATRTASGWPLWMWMKCSGNISFQTMTTVLLGNFPWKTVQTVLNLKDVYHQSIFLIIFFLSAQTESRSQRHWKLETCRPVWAAVLCVWRGRNVVTFFAVCCCCWGSAITYNDCGHHADYQWSFIGAVSSHLTLWCYCVTQQKKLSKINEFISLFFILKKYLKRKMQIQQGAMAVVRQCALDFFFSLEILFM